jgi:hypothetical protein
MGLGFRGAGGRVDDATSNSCAVQTAGESVKCEDGADCKDGVNSKDDSDVGVVVCCESSESVGVGLLVVGGR